jgi:hypothetical protein
MIDWLVISGTSGRPLEEINHPLASGTEYDNLYMYSARYSQIKEDVPAGCIRYQEGIFSDLGTGDSLFIFGAGHSSHCNTYWQFGTFGRIVATDVISESSLGLIDEVTFQLFDILEEEFPEDFDYIFSSHVVEHFTRDQLMETVLPKCLKHARKAVIFVAPYRDAAWSDAPEHRVRLSEEDELAAQASRWRLLLDGKELVLWFKGQAA